jgi:hypothetical protein
MWTIQDANTGITNKAVVLSDGIISITKPDSVQVNAYVNEEVSGVHHVHVKTGDSVYFKLIGTADTPTSVAFDFEGKTSTVIVPSATSALYSASILKGKDMTPMDTVNLFANPNQGNMGGALGGGLGAGLVGGLLGTMLFRNGGLGVDGTAAVPVQAVVNDAAVLTALGDIKAAIPYNEAQVQLALAVAQADINGNVSNSTNNITAALNTQSLANATNFAIQNSNLASSLGSITSTVNTAAAANLAATKDASLLAERNAWAVTQAITNDGDRTRSLIQSIDKSNDSRTITSQANEIVEMRHDRRLQEATGNITISNTNTATAQQQQSQAQQQLQAQYQILAQLAALNADVQSVKQSSVVFNSGTQVASGNQSAANTRVA